MVLDRNKTYALKLILVRAAKVPVAYLLAGMLLIGLSYVDNVFPLTQWKSIFDWTDVIGDIFIAFAIVTFIYKGIVLVLRRSEKKLFDRNRVAALVLASIRRGLRIIYILAALNIIISIAGPTKFYLVLANDTINTIIIGSIGWIAIQILYTFEAVIYQQMMTNARKDHVRAKALYTKTHIMRNIATVVIIMLTIAAMLMSFNSVRSIGVSLLASAGFLTAIIGLAGQKTLFSVFSGMQIAIAQPIKIGDIVVIDKESGIIEEITFTYVTLKLGDRRRLIVPINYFIEKPFENWSHDADSLRSSFHFYVDYLMPINVLREQLEIILRDSAFWDSKASKLQVANLGQHSVEVRIQVSAATADLLSDLRSEVREKMLEFIRESYPQHLPINRTLSIGSTDA